MLHKSPCFMARVSEALTSELPGVYLFFPNWGSRSPRVASTCPGTAKGQVVVTPAPAPA